MKTSRILIAAILLAAPLRAQVVNDGATNTLSNITSTFTGDVTVGTNGSFTLLILSDNALLTNSGNGLISRNATSRSDEVRLISASARWLMNGSLFVGSNGASATLVVSNGAFVRASAGNVGYLAASGSNVALVTGSGSMWSNINGLTVGLSSSGNQLTVSNGGWVVNNNSSLGNVGSNNVALVTGFGSVWSNRGDLNIAVVGSGNVNNRLLIEDGGQVCNQDAYLGGTAGGSNNFAVVSGTGSVWNNRDLRIGPTEGRNALVVSNGGMVLSANGFVGVGGSLSHFNLATVTGSSSLWSNGLDFGIGVAGYGNALVVSNGGWLVNSNGFIGGLSVANVSASNNTVTVTGAGSAWSNRADVFIGYAGSGNQLVISNGGLVVNSNSNVGFNTSSSGNVAVVTGPGSFWSNQAVLRIGYDGSGNRLVVSNGGLVQCSNGLLGTLASSSNNEAMITGAGSLWAIPGNLTLHVGFSGSGNRLVVSNGGVVFSPQVSVGDGEQSTNNRVVVDGGTFRAANLFGTGVLDVRRGTNVLNAGLVDVDQLLLTNTQGFFEFNGGTLVTRGAIISNGATFVVGPSGTTPAIWDVRAGVTNTFIAGDLIIGSNASFNQLILTNGALLTNASSAVLGWWADAKSNSVILAGAGSQWMMDDGLNLGEFGSFNRLVVSNGAALVTGAASSIGLDFPSTNNEAVVTGAGSSWRSPNSLFVGDLGRNNRLLVSDGGLVVDLIGSIGHFSSDTTNNEAVVTDAGTLWSNTLDLRVGDVGAANRLVVSNSGTVFAASAIYVGFTNSSIQNRLVVDGGTLRTTNATESGVLDVRRGTNVLNAGLVEVDRLRVTNTLGNFEFNGGTLSVKGSTVINGQLFRVGNGVSAATLNLAGNGSHLFNNGLIVSANATLTGNGSVSGAFTAQAGSQISPGASIGNILFGSPPSLQGATFMEIGRNGAVVTNDQIQVSGGITYGGTLTVTNVGPNAPVAGDHFQLFSAVSYGGGFATISLPPLPPGLNWTNRLLLDGSIEILAPPALPLSSGTYTQDFSALAGTGTSGAWRDNFTLLGWYAAQSNAPFAITTYRVSNGNDNSGGLYSFGTLNTNERALGSIAADTTGSIAYGLGFTNDTAAPVTNFTITYTGEQWRESSIPNPNTLSFWYRVSASALTNPEPGIVTNWTPVTNLDFVGPITNAVPMSLDGNAPGHRHTFAAVGIAGLVVTPGQCVFFRWRDLNDPFDDQGLAVDDLAVAFSVLSPPFLNIQRSANANVVLSWATNFSGFTLEANTNLNTNAWTAVSPAPAVSGTNNVVTNATTEALKFYRLFKP